MDADTLSTRTFRHVSFYQSALVQNLFLTQPLFSDQYIPPYLPFLKSVENFFFFFQQSGGNLWSPARSQETPHSSHGGGLRPNWCRVSASIQRLFPCCLAREDIACESLKWYSQIQLGKEIMLKVFFCNDYVFFLSPHLFLMYLCTRFYLDMCFWLSTTVCKWFKRNQITWTMSVPYTDKITFFKINYCVVLKEMFHFVGVLLLVCGCVNCWWETVFIFSCCLARDDIACDVDKVMW